MAEQKTDSTISDAAQNPKRTAVDGTEVEQHSLPDQIAADRYLASKKASKLKGLAGLFRKLVPPGAP